MTASEFAAGESTDRVLVGRKLVVWGLAATIYMPPNNGKRDIAEVDIFERWPNPVDRIRRKLSTAEFRNDQYRRNAVSIERAFFE